MIVALHVAELVENRYGLPGIPEARDRVQAQYQAQHDQAVTDEDLDEASQAEEVALDGLDEAWRAAYRAHGQAFTSAVHARAATLTGLTAPVTVHVTDDPDAAWWGTAPDPLNPTEDDDPLVWALWEHAVTTVPLPVDEQGHLTGPPAAGGSGLEQRPPWPGRPWWRCGA